MQPNRPPHAGLFLAIPLLFCLASAATAQTEAGARMNAFGNNWQKYEVESTADVRDFHVCMVKPDRQLQAREILAALDLGHKDAAGRDVDHPEGWQVSVDDGYPGHWCINFTPGPDARPLNGSDTFTLRFEAGQEVFDQMRSRSVTLLVTRTPENRRVSWDDDVLFRSERLVRGPRFAVSTERAADRERVSGAHLVLTGTVVGGEMASASVVGGDGARLSGVVVEVDGDELLSDDDGQIVFPVAAGLTAVVASLAGDGESAVRVPVVTPADGATALAPVVESAPSFVTPDRPFPIDGGGFSGVASGNTVRLGDNELDVLASSPSQLVVAAPSDLPLGTAALTVATPRGSSRSRALTLVGMRLESQDTTLHTGQKGEAYLVVVGTERPVRLTVTNLSGSIVMKGGETTRVRTSGGENNRARIRYRAVRPGPFELTAVVDGAGH